MKKQLIAIIICVVCIVCTGFAKNISPESLKISDNEQSKVVMSTQDINRIFVLHDKITSFNAPMNRLSAHNDQSGSIYLNVYGEKPFTAFVSTQKGHHFSLLVIPKSVPGNTIELVMTTPVNHNYIRHSQEASKYEKESTYQKTVVNLLKGAMLSKLPAGYSAIDPKGFKDISIFQVPNFVTGQKQLQQQVVAGYLGGELAVRIIQVKNNTRSTLQLVANSFYVQGVRGVSIAHEVLKPSQATYIYEVISNV